MGLAITRAILIAHGGGIEVSSVPGNGATFRFWVPLAEKEPLDGWTQLQDRAARGSMENLNSALAKIRDVPAEPNDRL